MYSLGFETGKFPSKNALRVYIACFPQPSHPCVSHYCYNEQFSRLLVVLCIFFYNLPVCDLCFSAAVHLFLISTEVFCVWTINTHIFFCLLFFICLNSIIELRIFILTLLDFFLVLSAFVFKITDIITKNFIQLL